MYYNRRVTRSMAKKMAMAKAKKVTPTKKRVTKSKKVAPSRRVTRSMTKKAKKSSKSLKCWSRKNGLGNKYVVCSGSKGQQKK